ncbi:MAG: TIGR03619 family F420-dependent LLM class oxidoreductase [Actinobacteria bacterium]|nr:TIGR03619 family F420-dependent LLM class oxidoreductase [Actinomycetota bacterium]
MQLPVQSQSRLYVEDWELDAGAAELAQVARAADEAGLLYIGVCDHVAIPRDRADKMGTVWFDTVATLGWLAAVTERVALLSHVLVPPLRHPLLVAKAFATLDVLSGGRALLGVGAGHVEVEFEVLGADFDGRGAVLDEAIDVIRAAFVDEWPEHHGDRLDVADVGVAPRPVQDGGPPIWVGGSSRRALRRVGERGDGWLPQGTPRPLLGEQIAVLREAAEAAGRDPADIAVGANELLYVGEPDWEVGRWCTSGAPEQLAEHLRPLRDLGVSHVQATFRSRSADELDDQLRRFGAEVLPLLTD